MYPTREFVIKKGVLEKYIGKATHVVIPQGVTAIGKEAFARYEELTGVVIPDSVTSIGESAFYQCRKLTDLILPDSITAIGEYAFYDCRRLRQIRIPQGIRTIRRSTFEECHNLTSVCLPESLVSIEYGGFSHCNSLQSIKLPEGITRLGQFAFSQCSSLTELYIPDSVTSIEPYAFCGCTGLKSFTFPKNIRFLSESILSRCCGLEHITIPFGVISIGPYAFSLCNSLQHITIPDSVTSIGKNAFEYCSSLKSLRIPESVRSIGEGAFSHCHDLPEFTVPSTVISVGRYAFAHCATLEQLTLSENAHNLSGYINQVVLNCDKLKVIVAPSVPPESFDSDRKTAVALGYLLCPHRYDPTVAKAYQGCVSSRQTHVLLSIFSLDLSECLPHFLETIKVPLKKFDQRLLQPALAQNATNCVAFLMDWKSSHFSPMDFGELLQWELEEDPYSVAQMRKLWNYQKLPENTLCITGYKGIETRLVIPERIGQGRVTAIGDEAFSTAKRHRTHAQKDLLELIESVEIPEGVTSIGTCAFYGCRSLKMVIVPTGVTQISPSAFRLCNVTLWGSQGSYAQQYAMEHGIPFVVI